MRHEEIMPYDKQGPKREQVEKMFDSIAPTYDRLNHTLALGIDRRWRSRAIDALKPFRPQHVLDIATGTGDFAILAAERLQPASVMGIDISQGMMDVARKKVAQRGLQNIVHFATGDCTALTMPDASVDAVTIAYGARNFADLHTALCETARVLRRGGHLMLVELTTPPRFPMKQLFWIYAHVCMPVVGRLISHDDSAYTYLPQSMAAFPQAEELAPLMRECGFAEVTYRRFTFGLSTMYLATK